MCTRQPHNSPLIASQQAEWPSMLRGVGVAKHAQGGGPVCRPSPNLNNHLISLPVYAYIAVTCSQDGESGWYLPKGHPPPLQPLRHLVWYRHGHEGPRPCRAGFYPPGFIWGASKALPPSIKCSTAVGNTAVGNPARGMSIMDSA